MVVKDILTAQRPDTCRMEVCVLHDIGVLGKELSEMGYCIHYLNWSQDHLNDFQIIKKLRTLIKQRHIDIIHAHNITPWYFSALASLGLRKKLCVTIHGFISDRVKLKKIFLYILLSYRTEKIITVSDSIKRNISGFPLIRSKSIETIINGIRLIGDTSITRDEKRRELGLSPEDFVIGTVGRLFPEKNIEMQLEMAGKLVPLIPTLKLVVVSKKYDYIQKLESIVEQLGISRHVIFTGLRRDIPEILATFDIFIMTSFSEGTSIALLEAMSAGLPLLVSDVGGNRDIIKHNSNGLLFEVHDFNAFCCYIQDLHRDANLRYRLAENAKESSTAYSIQGMLNRYRDVYCSMIRSN
jgi:glycosyltransferase involved in cell wall biosynthesis